jgi:hypothetical protein
MKSINKRLGSLVNSTILEHLLCIFCENIKCSSCASLEHVLKIYSERERVWRISWMHQSFDKSNIMTTKVLEV